MSFLQSGATAPAGGFSDAIIGADGCVYGMPFGYEYSSRRFLRFDPTTETLIEFGPDIETEFVICGAFATSNGCIYVSIPGDTNMIKIDTNLNSKSYGMVTILRDIFPAGVSSLFRNGVFCEGDGCLYFLSIVGKVQKFNPKDATAELLDLRTQDELFEGIGKFCNLIAGKDDCLYCISLNGILKFDPTTQSTFSYKYKGTIDTYLGFVLARDGCIYGIADDTQLFGFNTKKMTLEYLSKPMSNFQGGDPVLGIDGCIYWPPNKSHRTLKFDTYLHQISFVDSTLTTGGGCFRGATAGNGKTYFFPFFIPSPNRRILAVDPFNDLKSDFQSRFKNHPMQLGKIFEEEDIEEVDDDDCGVDSSTTKKFVPFDIAVQKFGIDSIVQVVDDCIKVNKDVYKNMEIPVFLIAATYHDNCPLNIIYHLLRKHVDEFVPLLHGGDNKDKEKEKKSTDDVEASSDRPEKKLKM